jgi:hypothetical protein
MRVGCELWSTEILQATSDASEIYWATEQEEAALVAWRQLVKRRERMVFYVSYKSESETTRPDCATAGLITLC